MANASSQCVNTLYTRGYEPWSVTKAPPRVDFKQARPVPTGRRGDFRSMLRLFRRMVRLRDGGPQNRLLLGPRRRRRAGPVEAGGPWRGARWAHLKKMYFSLSSASNLPRVHLKHATKRAFDQTSRRPHRRRNGPPERSRNGVHGCPKPAGPGLLALQKADPSSRGPFPRVWPFARTLVRPLKDGCGRGDRPATLWDRHNLKRRSL
jgi:hypothetical protein